MASKADYMSEMLSLEEIISRSNKKHKNRYDYSKTKKSFGRNTIMKIICPLHGMFELKAESHYNGRGCSECKGKICHPSE